MKVSFKGRYCYNNTMLTMLYTIRNGSERDSDTYFCVTGTNDECFAHSLNLPYKAMKVSFKGRYC